MDDRTEIVDVWANNLEEEFERIRDVVENHPYVAIDTEFPGIVARPTGNVLDYNYQTIKCNVDLLKVIQLGVTFSNGKGELPKISTWQFNFKFDLDCDMYAQNSIDFLKCSGINFEKHQSLGIELLHFGEVIMSSGLVMNEDVKWISFHGCYDFAYLLKILTCSALPQNETAFFDLLNDFFPSLYDIKYLLLNLNIKQLSRTFSLQKISEILSVKRIGRQHQAGSDSLVTCKTFFKLMELYFDNKIDDKKYSGIIYGLGPTIKNYQHKDKEEHDAKYRYSNSFKKNSHWNRNNGGLALQNSNSITGTKNENINNKDSNSNNENNEESKEDNQTDSNKETNNNNDHGNNNNDNNNNNDDNNNNNNGNSSSNNNNSNNNGNNSSNNNDSSNNNNNNSSNNNNNNNSSSGNNSSAHYEKYEKGNNAHYEKCIVKNDNKNVMDLNTNKAEGVTKKKENKQLQKHKRTGIYNNSINPKAINPHYVEVMMQNNNKHNMKQNYPMEGSINIMNSISEEENIHRNIENIASKHSNIKNVIQQNAQQYITENSSTINNGKEINIKNEKGMKRNVLKLTSQGNQTKIMSSNGNEILNGKTKDVTLDKGEKTNHLSTFSHLTNSKNTTEVSKCTKMNQVPISDMSERVSGVVSGKKHVGCNVISMNGNERNGRNTDLNATIVEKVSDIIDMNHNKTVHSVEFTNETSNEMDTQEIDDTTGMLQKNEDPLNASQRNNMSSSLDTNEMNTMNTVSEPSVGNMNESNNSSSNKQSSSMYQHNYKVQQEGMINDNMFNSSNTNATNCNNTTESFIRNLNYGSCKIDMRSKSSVHTMNGKGSTYHYGKGNKINNLANANLNHMNYANEMSKVHVSNNNGLYGTNDTEEMDMKKSGTENVAFANYITKCKNHKNNWIKAGNKFENYRNNMNSNYKNQFKKALSTLSNDHMYQWSSNCNRTMFMNSNQWNGINMSNTKNTVQNTVSISETTDLLHKNAERGDVYDIVYASSSDKNGVSKVNEGRNEKEDVKTSGFINSTTSTGINLSVPGVCSSTILDSNETNVTKLASSLHSNEHFLNNYKKNNLNTNTTLANNQYNLNIKLGCTGTGSYVGSTINNSLENVEGNNTASTVEGNEKKNTSNKHNKKVTMIKKYSPSSKGSSGFSSSSPSCGTTTITTINNNNNSTVNENNRMKHAKEQDQDQKRGSSVNGSSNPVILNKEHNENSFSNIGGNIIINKNKRGNAGRGNRNNTTNVAGRNVKGSVSQYYNVPNQKKGNSKNHNTYYANTVEENVHISNASTKIHEKNYKTNSGIGYMDRGQYNINYTGNINYGKSYNKMYRAYGKNFTPILLKGGNSQSAGSNSGTVHNGINCNVSSTTIDNDNEYIGNEGTTGNTIGTSLAMETVPSMNSRDMNTLHMYNMNLGTGTRDTEISVKDMEINAESVNHTIGKTMERVKNYSSPMRNNCNKNIKCTNKFQIDLNSYNRSNMVLGPHNFRNKSRMSEHVSNINHSNNSYIGNYMNLNTYSIHNTTNFSDPIGNISLLNSNHTTTVHSSNSHLTNDGHDNSSTTYMDLTNNNHLYSRKIEGMECTMNYHNTEPTCEDQNQQNVHETDNNKYNYVNYEF